MGKTFEVRGPRELMGRNAAIFLMSWRTERNRGALFSALLHGQITA